MITKIEITVKGKKSAKKFDTAHDDFINDLNEAGAKGSTGIFGIYFEDIVRYCWRKSGLAPDDFRVHSAGEHDAMNRKNGGLEVKTGSGIIGYTRTETISEEYCPLDKYVAYTAKPQEMRTLDDVLDNTLLFTREEFLQFVATIGLKRKAGNFASGCKLGVDNKALRKANETRPRGAKLHDCIVLQPTYLEARYAACISGEYTTLRTFLEENG